MADKQPSQPRRLPQWYLDKVNLAAEVFSGSPDYVDKRRPWVPHRAPMGQGVGAQRVGTVGPKHIKATRQRAATSGTQPDPVNGTPSTSEPR